MAEDTDYAQNEATEVAVAVSTNSTTAGFWRRLIAFLIDGLLLGLVGLIIGIFLFDFLAQLGGWGRLVGFCIALGYFGLLNSFIGKGQTLGKRIMKIEVVGREGSNISVGRSFIRYMIFAVPFFLNGLIISPSITQSAIGYVIGFIIFAFGGSIIYLYIFNRRTRQSLHDLVVGTFVVRTDPKGEVAATLVWNGHFVVVGIWFLVIFGLLVIAPIVSHIGIFPELFAVQKSIQASGKVHVATVFVGKSWGSTGDETWETTYFSSNAIWKSRPDDFEVAAAQIAAIVLDEYSEIMQKDILAITVTYGYDIGIARAWRKWNVRHSPQEWLEILSESGVEEK